MPGDAGGVWIVARPGGPHDLPMWGTYYDEDEARAEAKRARALLIGLPVIADYRNLPRDPCPACGQADLEPQGAKHVCPGCGYIQPCCQPP